MDTKQVYKMIDTCYHNRLEEKGLAYNLRKTKNAEEWKVKIGKFEAITDPYIEGYVNDYQVDILGQFGEILEIAVKRI